jgi:outer membrane protein TolC
VKERITERTRGLLALGLLEALPARKSQLRKGGATSYLEVLDSDTRMFSAELGVTEAELSELLSLVQVYRALAGGWQP